MFSTLPKDTTYAKSFPKKILFLYEEMLAIMRFGKKGACTVRMSESGSVTAAVDI
jgi:hypothetical protein